MSLPVEMCAHVNIQERDHSSRCTIASVPIPAHVHVYVQINDL